MKVENNQRSVMYEVSPLWHLRLPKEVKMVKYFYTAALYIIMPSHLVR